MNKLVLLLLITAGSASAAPSVEVGFSPEGSAQKLVLDTINSAHSSIQMIAYAFQAKDIAAALDAAKQRGVRVQVVIDKRRNRGKTSLDAMRDIASHGVELRIDGGLAPIFPDTFYRLTHYWFAAADIPVANDIPVHCADAIRCNVRRPPQGSLPLLTRQVLA